MGLVTSNQFQGVPDVVGSLSRGMNVGDQFRQNQLQKAQSQFLEGGGMQSPTGLQDSAKFGLDFQSKVAEGLGLIDKQTKQIDQSRLNEAADFAYRIQSLPLDQQNIEINKRIEYLENNGRNADQTRELLTMEPEQRSKAFQVVQVGALPNEKRLEAIRELQGGNKANIQFGGQETFKDEAGNVFFATSKRNPNTGDIQSVVTPMIDGVQVSGKLQPVSGSGLTQSEKVQQSGAIKGTEFTEKRRSEITAELSTRNRDATRSLPRIKQALQLASTADQGLTGSAKIKLAKLIPGIDVSDEGQLQSALLQLSLDQLQNFKGPTTDFEFGVTQSITGSLGDSKSSNISRLNSLDRANWFNQREFKQFREFTKSGGDPDEFAFDFNETVKTKRGEVSLQDLQDTAVENNLTIDETIKRLNL